MPLVRKLMILMAISLTCVVSAQEKTSFIIGSHNIKYYPHYDFDSDVKKGFAWSFLEAFAKHEGITFDYVSLPIKRLQTELINGNVDVVFPDNPKWYNQIVPLESKTFSQPVYFALGGSFVLRRNEDIVVDDVKRVSVPNGFSPVMWRDRIESNLTMLLEVSDSMAALNLVLSGRADISDMEYSTVEYLKSKHPIYNDIILAPNLPFDVVAFHMATIRYPELMIALDRFMQSNETFIADLKKQHGIADAHAVATRTFGGTTVHLAEKNED